MHIASTNPHVDRPSILTHQREHQLSDLLKDPSDTSETSSAAASGPSASTSHTVAVDEFELRVMALPVGQAASSEGGEGSNGGGSTLSTDGSGMWRLVQTVGFLAGECIISMKMITLKVELNLTSLKMISLKVELNLTSLKMVALKVPLSITITQ